MESERTITSRISERQMRLWNALHPTKPNRSPINRFITISRDEGTLGDEIAQNLSERLKWQLYDKELVNQVADNSHVRQELVLQLDEKSCFVRDTILDAVLHLIKMPEITEFASEQYHKSLLKTIATIAAYGNSIIIGRGANFVLYWAPQGLHFRFTASMDIRIERLSNAWQVSPEIAKKRMEAIDAGRREFVRHHFGKDLDDPRFYNAVFNTDRLSIQQIVASILTLMRPEFLQPASALSEKAIAH
jgi:cytidylate kinase